ncbi:glycosyltransferase [Bipolaris maydis]|uniref:glycosyltransferase n=1 Tax=Cochliobolus heterostrophus TaxID=5016 RepID=UPI0024DC825F|nr:glycosyltransferase [Bipolaris maydis]KAJ6270471.1 glycosyltransferase [Bipolaris maydis]
MYIKQLSIHLLVASFSKLVVLLSVPTFVKKELVTAGVLVRLQTLKYLSFLTLAISLIFYLTHTTPSPSLSPPLLASDPSSTPPQDDKPRSQIGKATASFGPKDTTYEAAISSHHTHDTLHGYPHFILRQRMPPGLCHVHLIVTNDRHGLNNVRFLSASLSLRVCDPNVALKYSEQSAMEIVAGRRPERMAQWQRIAASPRNEWNKALNSTRYVSEMDEFWRGLGEGEDEGCVVNDIGGRK